MLRSLGMHLKAHGITATEYRERWPGAPLVAEDDRKKMIERIQSPSIREKQRLAARKEMKRRWRDKKYRDMMSRSAKKRWSNPEFKKRQKSRAHRFLLELWQRPEYRKQHLDRLQSEEHRESAAARLRQLWKDPDYVDKFVRLAKERRWPNQEAHEKHKRQMREKWTDPEHRRKVHGRRQWWKDEIAFRDAILKPLGLYGPSGFSDHVQISGKSLSFNADFACRRLRVIIHVDGWYHYSPKAPRYLWRVSRDAKIDRWCIRNGWLFLRLTDQDIYHKPNMCRNMVRRLVEWKIVPVYATGTTGMQDSPANPSP